MAITAQAGNKIKVHYTGTLADGTVFDSSIGAEPLAFELGSGMVIPGFDAGLMGMAIGESKTINIPFMQAYGPVHAENILEVPRHEMPADMEIEVGTALNLHQDGSAEVIPVVITALTADTVTIDANHPLAGKDLIFMVEMMEIEA